MPKKRKRLPRYAQEKKAKELLKKGLTFNEVKDLMAIGGDKLVRFSREIKEEEQQVLDLKTHQEEEKARLVARYEEVEPAIKELPKRYEILEAKTEVLGEKTDNLGKEVEDIAELAHIMVKTELKAKTELWNFAREARKEGKVDPNLVIASLSKK